MLSKKLKSRMENNEGVSPVIGVILMVAITVIMAAIVASFVFGVIQTPQATPAASIAISDISKTDPGNISVTLLHQSGDELNGSNIKVIISNLDLRDSAISEPLPIETFSPGERVTLTANESTGQNFNQPLDYHSGDNYEVRVVHTPSGGTISAPTETAP